MATFGYSAGVATNGLWGYGVMGSKYTLSEAGLVSRLSVHCRNFSTDFDMKGLIYAADGAGGKPGTRMGVSSAVTVLNGFDGTKDLDFAVPFDLSPGDYWLMSHTTTCGVNQAQYCAATGGTSWWADGSAGTYASPPAPWSFASEGSQPDTRLNVYATYTVTTFTGLTVTKLLQG
jgi:hypothetical protein